jgi:hypothetical protein
MKKQTKKEIKIKDLFTLSERTNNGAVVTTLENGNKYCFGYFSEEDKPEIKNMMAKRERKVTASLNRRDLNENVFATKINDILSWWSDNLDKYEIIAHAAKQLQRIESKRYELTMMRQRINNHEQVSEILCTNMFPNGSGGRQGIFEPRRLKINAQDLEDGFRCGDKKDKVSQYGCRGDDR